MIDPAQLQGLAPDRVVWRGEIPEVHWSDPHNPHASQRTLLDDLVGLEQAGVSLPLAGLILHMSRCGSTLMARVLAGSPDTLVVSEHPAVDAVLDTARRGVAEERRAAWLRGMLAALSRSQGRERRAVFKLDSWHILDLPLIRRACPGVPWVFVYRDPVEVLVSHQRQRGMQMVPGLVAPARLGLAALEEQAPGDLDAFCARVLARFCAAAADYVPAYGGALVHYDQLPAAIWSPILPLFGLRPTQAERVAMEQRLRHHAKQPAQLFSPDGADKRRAASEHQRELAERYVGAAYQRLEALRLLQVTSDE
jgi:hypothetical protein